VLSLKVNVILPVAGEGTRLRPHTHAVPKSLLYVAGKPILGHILDGLKDVEVSNFVIVLGAKADAIIDFCNKYPRDFRYVLQEERLGLGHAIHLGAQGLEGPTLVLLGDTIIDVDYRSFCRSGSNVLAIKEVDDPKRFGIVEVKGGDVIDLVEKPKQPRSNLAIVGLYYFQDIIRVAKAIDYIIKDDIKTKNEYQLTDALKYMLDKGEKFKISRIDNWYDCGTAAALIDTNRHILKKTHHYKTRKQSIMIAPVYVADSATIAESIIGPNVSIGEGAVIKNSIIKDSIINNGANVENALLVESIIGVNASVKSGYKRLSVSDSSVVEYP
jgi:glucose-1-phosphate thymidylyltransferase